MDHKCIALTILLFVGATFVLSEENDHDDIFHNVQDIVKMVGFIKKSPNQYAKFVRSISKAIDMRNVLRQVHFVHDIENSGHLGNHVEFRSGLAADNITDLPVTVSSPDTGSTNESVITSVMTTILPMTESSTKEATTTKPTTKKPKPTKPPRVSELCQNHSDAVFISLGQQEEWALRMIDAAGKPPANILGGGTLWWGDYEECIAVKASTNFSEIVYNFDVKYCKVRLRGLFDGLLPISPQITVGMCFPDSCGITDIRNLINDALKEASSDVRANSVVCQEITRDIPYDTRAIIVLIVIGLFIAVMALGTAYDVILIQWPKWKQKEKDNKMNRESAVEADEKSPLIDQQKVPEYQPGIPGKLLLSFSVYTNGAKILSTDQGKDVLTCVNGIRFLSMTWVILGHAYSAPLSIADNGATFLPKMIERWTFFAVANAFPSVDTFFALSGCLLTYLVMKELKKNNGKMKWGMFYFHRFWRLTPPYMLVLMVYVSLFHYTGSGPNWVKDGPERNHCEKGWYYNLLYVNNFVEDRDSKCMGWAWYLANDMQFFVLSPLIILPLYYFHLVGVGVLMVFLLGTWIATGVISTHYNISVSNFDEGLGAKNADRQKIYIKPYCRMGPYLVGMYTGYLLYKFNGKFRMNKYVNLLGWAVATAAGLTVVYSVYDDVNNGVWSTGVSSFYNTVHRTVWGACVCWVIFTCATGYGGYVNTLLSWKGMIPLSRLTYMAYLTHMPVITHFRMTQNKMIHLSDKEFIYEFLGHTVISYMIAFVTSLAFESPMMGLERVIFRRGERGR